MIRTVLVLLSTARRLRLGPCTPLGSGGEAQFMGWAHSLQVVTCLGRHGGLRGVVLAVTQGESDSGCRCSNIVERPSRGRRSGRLR